MFKTWLGKLVSEKFLQTNKVGGGEKPKMKKSEKSEQRKTKST